MKRRVILISALLMIGIITGIAISQLISNTTNFSVHVDGAAPLRATMMEAPSGNIFQDQMYKDIALINVTNLDPNQGYNFWLNITVEAINNGNSLDPGSVTMTITSGVDSQGPFGDARTIGFSQSPSSNSIISGTYLASQKIPIAALNSGGANQVFFDVSFEMSGASAGNYVFYYNALIA